MSHPSKAKRIVIVKTSEQQNASGTTCTNEQIPHQQQQNTQPVVVMQKQNHPNIMPVPTLVPYMNPETDQQVAANICHRFTNVPKDKRGWVGYKTW